MFIYPPVGKTMGKSSQSQNNIQKVIDDLYRDERLFVNLIGGPYLFKRTPLRKKTLKKKKGRLESDDMFILLEYLRNKV